MYRGKPKMYSARFLKFHCIWVEKRDLVFSKVFTKLAVKNIVFTSCRELPICFHLLFTNWLGIPVNFDKLRFLWCSVVLASFLATYLSLQSVVFHRQVVHFFPSINLQTKTKRTSGRDRLNWYQLSFWGHGQTAVKEETNFFVLEMRAGDKNPWKVVTFVEAGYSWEALISRWNIFTRFVTVTFQTSSWSSQQQTRASRQNEIRLGSCNSTSVWWRRVRATEAYKYYSYNV